MAELDIEPLSEANLDELDAMFQAVDSTTFHHATREAANRFLAERRDIHVLGRANGEVVAFGMLRGWEEGYDVPSLGLVVRRDAEGKGHGRSMMTALERMARGRGASQIRLRVHPRNARARHLYEKCGYRVAGEERGETLMLRDLSPGDHP